MVRLLTQKEIAEKRSKISGRVGELLKQSAERALTAEERSEFERLEAEAADVDKSFEEHNTRARMEKLARSNPDSAPDFKLEKDHPFANLERFSLLSACRQIDNGQEVRGFEREVSDFCAAEAMKCNVPVRGDFRIPYELPMFVPGNRRSAHTPGETRAATTSTSASGAVVTNTASTFIDVLRNELVLFAAGAQVVPNLVGTFKLPVKTSKASGSWGNGNHVQTAAAMTFGARTFSPKHVTAEVVIERELMTQTSLDMEMIARNDIAMALAEAIDYGGFHGSGASSQPTGIAANADCIVVELGTDGGPMTWAKANKMMTLIASKNVRSNRIVYVTSAVGYGELVTTPKIGSTYPIYLAEGGQMAGRPVLVSNQIRDNLTKGATTAGCSAVFCGDFSNVFIGLWGSVDFLFDKITNKPGLTIDAWQTCDVVFRYPDAITKVVDLKPAA